MSSRFFDNQNVHLSVANLGLVNLPQSAPSALSSCVGSMHFFMGYLFHTPFAQGNIHEVKWITACAVVNPLKSSKLVDNCAHVLLSLSSRLSRISLTSLMKGPVFLLTYFVKIL
jgi:hypothetical protein